MLWKKPAAAKATAKATAKASCRCIVSKHILPAVIILTAVFLSVNTNPISLIFGEATNTTTTGTTITADRTGIPEISAMTHTQPGKSNTEVTREEVVSGRDVAPLSKLFKSTVTCERSNMATEEEESNLNYFYSMDMDTYSTEAEELFSSVLSEDWSDMLSSGYSDDEIGAYEQPADNEPNGVQNATNATYCPGGSSSKRHLRSRDEKVIESSDYSLEQVKAPRNRMVRRQLSHLNLDQS